MKPGPVGSAKTSTRPVKTFAIKGAKPKPKPKDLDVEAIQAGHSGIVEQLPNAFRDRAKAEAGRFMDAVDSEYWVAICFQTRAQKDEFLAGLGIAELGDKYLDGLEVAECLEVPIKSPTPKWKDAKPSARLVKLVR